LQWLAVASIALGVAASSALVCSARWWWLGDLASSFAWHLGWLTLAAAITLALLRARWLAVAALALAAIHLWPEARLWWPARVERGSRPSLRIADANLLQPNERFDDVAAALRALDPDVITVEELSPQMREALERKLDAWPHRVFSADPNSHWHQGTWGLGLFSRLPIASSRLVQLGECYAPAIEAVIALGNGELVLRVVHIPRPGRVAHMQRRAGALEAFVTQFDWPATSAAVGDFNLTASSPGFAPLLERTGLRDSRAGFGRQPTWILHQLVVPLAITIDHALVGCDVDVLSRRTYTIPGSDHDGVCIELALR
jgi:endonuclease/exonuclease/phosphatase (EEP) superfamily protein YafD